MLLGAPTRRAWSETHLVRHQTRYDQPGATAGEWRSLPDLLCDDAAVLRDIRYRLVGDGYPPRSAVMILAGWFGGGVADAMGFALATASAAIVPVRESLGWRITDGGWPDRVRFDTERLVVDRGHPWSESPRVDVVDGSDDVIDAAVQSLVEATRPLVDECRRLAKVGTVGLWNEIGDALGLCVDNADAIAADERVIATLRRATGAAGAPWRARPRLRVADHHALGPIYVAQKGGCCLAYLGAHRANTAAADVTGERRAYIERFPDDHQYCSTCSLIDNDACAARQIYWLERAASPPLDH